MKTEDLIKLEVKQEDNEIDTKHIISEKSFKLSITRKYCALCGEYFPKPSDLRAHIFETHSSAAKDYRQCKTCEKVFVEKGRRKFEEHEIKCIQKYTAHMKVVCTKCNQTFSSKSIKRHIKSNVCLKPKEPRLFQKSLLCSYCGKDLKEKKRKSRYKHISTCKRAPVQCDDCGKSYKSISVHRLNICPALKPKPEPKSISEVSDSYRRRRLKQVVESYNQETRKSGIGARRRCWSSLRKRWPELEDSFLAKIPLEGNDQEEIRKAAGLSQDQVVGLMDCLREKWGGEMVK